MDQAEDHDHESPVEFMNSKGIVGECWERCSPAYRDWSSTNKRWAGRNISREEWNTPPAKQRANFTLPEFQCLVGKYSEVLAVPVMIDGRFADCIAVDLKWHPEGASSSAVLKRANARPSIQRSSKN